MPFHVEFSSNRTPRNLIDSARLISYLFIFSLESKREISSFLLCLWKNEYFFDIE